MLQLISRAYGGMKRRVEEVRSNLSVRMKTKHLCGPAHISLADDECAVVSLVKDAEYFLEHFLLHHFNLGASYVVLLDNGSTDATLEIARSFDRVIVASNSLPARYYECLLRKWAAKRFVSGGWILFVDSDELFDIPLGNQIGNLIRYCNRNGFTSVVTQMLDLFCSMPYSAVSKLTYAESIAAMGCYSLNQLTSIPYHDVDQIAFNYFLTNNVCGFSPLHLYKGGIRREVFGEDCFLSKHSLVRNIDGVDLMSHPHCASGVCCADVTAVLRHYKLSGAYLDRDRRSVTACTWDHGEDRRRLQTAGKGEAFAITCIEPRRYRGTGALIDEGFLVCSDRYRVAMQQA